MTTIIEFEIEESVLEEIDKAAAEVGISREVFMRVAIKHALRYHRLMELRERDEAGYHLWPPDDDEVDEWSDVQDWGDPWNEPGSNSSN